ncbi:hypothetical protein OUZ56_026600 [Daphnia magna]|uniref:Uncharacterized protein n=1 Tax=Daphnia magna TaxID=35525 RepID=A0ABQ9ZM97_9CRUS|nr:hypothetical protein OUZ56_026600 [Daphnia magna]
MGLFVPGCDCSTTGAYRPLSIPAASSSMTLVTFTGIICRKLACRTHSSEIAEHNRGIFMTPAAGSTCGQCWSTSSPQPRGKACRAEFSALASTFGGQRSGDSLHIAVPYSTFLPSDVRIMAEHPVRYLCTQWVVPGMSVG